MKGFDLFEVVDETVIGQLDTVRYGVTAFNGVLMVHGEFTKVTSQGNIDAC